MARRLLAPYLIIAVLAGLALLGGRLQTYELDYTNMCSDALTQLESPAADILFMGNSRMGASVDPVYIGEEIAERIGRPVTVERMTLTNNAITPFRVFSGNYARHRGFPKIVVLQLTYNRDPALQRSVDTPIHPPRNLAFARLSDMSDIQETAQMNDHGARISRRFERGYRNLPAIVIDRLTMNIYAALRYPAHRITGRPTSCTDEFVHRQADIWLHDTLSDAVLERPHRSPEPENLAEWREITSGYVPIDPTATDRTFENDQIRRLIATLRAGGSTVYLTNLPSVGEPAILEADKQAIARIFPNAPLIDLTPLQSRDPTIMFDYRDQDHVNLRGSAAISGYFAEQLADVYP